MSRLPKKTPDPFASILCVVFDAVGTLIYPNPPVAQAYHEAGLEHGSALTPAQIKHNFVLAIKQHNCSPVTNEQIERDRWQRIVTDVFTDVGDTESLFDQLWNHFALPTSWAVYDDVEPTFAVLEDSGIQLAIASNFDDRLLSIASSLPPLDRVPNIFVSSQLGFTKPAVEFFRAIEVELQLRPSQLLMIGDDKINDRNGAKQAGWHAMMIDRKSAVTDPTQIASLAELSNAL